MKKQYFTTREAVNLLGKPICFKQTKYLEVEGQKYPMIEQGEPGHVFNVTKLSEGIVLGVLVDGDIEEFRKDQFYDYCRMGCSGNPGGI